MAVKNALRDQNEVLQLYTKSKIIRNVIFSKLYHPIRIFLMYPLDNKSEWM